MNDEDRVHAPTPEFRAALERQLARTLRNDAQFGRSRPTYRRRLGTMIGLPLGAIVTIMIGVAAGRTTTYASAQDTGAQRHPSPTPTNMMRNAITALTCGVVTLAPNIVTAQSGIPVVELPPASVRTTETFGGILGLKQTSEGRLLVNDAQRRQLVLYDTTLASPRIVFDSTEGEPNSYGQLRVALQPYLGDSTLVMDIRSGPATLLVLNGRGAVARALALPRPMDGGSFGRGTTGVDDKGRLYYALTGRVSGTPAGMVGTQETFPDSTPVLRADLETRRVDTVGRVGRNKGEHTRIDHTDPKKIIRTVIVNPLPSPDEWAVLTDGSVAFVRGHDYHVDFVRPDGSTSSTPKLPFDWRRLTDEDKKKLIDSATAAHAEQNAFAEKWRNAPPPPPPLTDNASGSGQRTGGGAGVTRAAYDAMGTLWVPLSYEIVDAKDIPDFYPAIRQGAVMADFDNHLWVLPTTSAQSLHGELVYDMIDTKGALIQRVRLPVGRSIAGFAKDGVVYMISGDRTAGFHLERTRLPAPK